MEKETDNRETMEKSNSKKAVKKKKAVRKKSEPKAAPEVKPEVRVSKFEDLEGKFLLVRVGDNMRPATDADIQEIEEKIVGLLEKNDVNSLVFVTHHAVDMQIIE